MAAETALVHLRAGLELLGFGLDEIPRPIVAVVLTSYPRLEIQVGVP
jgi:hypothetical protein